MTNDDDTHMTNDATDAQKLVSGDKDSAFGTYTQILGATVVNRGRIGRPTIAALLAVGVDGLDRKPNDVYMDLLQAGIPLGVIADAVENFQALLKEYVSELGAASGIVVVPGPDDTQKPN